MAVSGFVRFIQLDSIGISFFRAAKPRYIKSLREFITLKFFTKGFSGYTQ